MTGSKRVADAAPDGYTVVLGTVGTHAQGQTLYKKPLYNSVDRFHAGGADRRGADHPDRAQGPAGEGLQGIRRLRQGKPGQDAVRLGRRRLGDPSRLRAAQLHHRHQHHARALSRHRTGDAGSAGRPHRFPVRDHHHRQAAGRRRHRAGRWRSSTASVRPRCRTCRPPPSRAPRSSRPIPGTRCSCRRVRPRTSSRSSTMPPCRR